MNKLALYALVASLGFSGLVSAQINGSAAFDKLRSLNGEWEGTYAWTGRNASGKISAQYSSTGNGSAVVENLTVDGTPSMTSVYHMDGTDLRLTHFCAAQNQPRLKASAIDLNSGQITFSFLDITNLQSTGAGHVQGLDVRFLTNDHITLSFHFLGESKTSEELIDLRRKK